MSESKRVMFYSHDTFGLGHIRRTQKIANAIADGKKSILIACSSPLANSFSSRPGIEYLNLPGFAKQVSGEYQPRSLNIPLPEFVALRASLLLAAVKNFRPDLIVVDKEPTGVKGELLPALRYLKEEKLPTKIACGFRDILDEREVVAAEWARKGVLETLETYYDHLLVYGEEANLDFVKEYSLPEKLAQRVRYTGYVQPKDGIDQAYFPLDFPKDQPIVTFTLGGGGDGWDFIATYLDMVERGLAGDDLNYVLLTGPFADIPLVERAKKIEATKPNFKVLGFTSNALGLFDRSRLVISMGGYNSFCELLHMRKFPLILPRIKPRQEQLIRAQAFRNKGYCDFLHPSELSMGALAAKIRSTVAVDRSLVPSFETNGLENMSRFIEEVLACQPASGSFSKVIPA